MKTFNGDSKEQLINFLSLLKEKEIFEYVFNSNADITSTNIKKIGESLGLIIKYVCQVGPSPYPEGMSGSVHKMEVVSKGEVSFYNCFIPPEKAIQHLEVRLGRGKAECVHAAMLYAHEKEITVEFSVGEWTYMIDPSGQIQCKRCD